jgi:hypothetical protein
VFVKVYLEKLGFESIDSVKWIAIPSVDVAQSFEVSEETKKQRKEEFTTASFLPDCLT